MIQNPHRSFPVNSQIIASDQISRIFYILRKIVDLFIKMLIVFTFGWTNLDPPRVQYSMVEYDTG